MKLTILTAAKLEAAEAAAWYDDRRRGLGDEFLAEVADAFDHIRHDPQMSTRLEAYSGTHNVRRYVLKRFPYLIVYACLAEETLVVAIAHVRRKPLYWLERLGP
ncbi:MAG: type II toxin-antitoxin system RelE/ParE family toxin [Pirellulales bacterium]